MSKCCIYCRIAGKDTEANRIAMEAQANDLREAADRLGNNRQKIAWREQQEDNHGSEAIPPVG